MPLRELTMSPLARAHSRTRARSLTAAASRMIAELSGEPISSSGLATKTSRAKGSQAVASAASSTPTPASPRSAARAYSPASSPLFMSVTPGP